MTVPTPSHPAREPSRGRWFGASLAAVALGTAASAGRAETHALRRPLAVRVEAEGCTAVVIHGSGVALGGRRVATVAHVVAGATAVRAVVPARGALDATVVAIDTDRDLAVLDVDGLDEPAVPRRALAEREEGSYVGFGRDEAPTVPFSVERAASIVSEDIYVRGRVARPGYVLRAAVTHGDSGAGLVARDGALGGLVWAAGRNDATQGWGVSVDALGALLDTIPADAGAAPRVACSPP